MTGSDWTYYQSNYEFIGKGKHFTVEIGYMFLNMIFYSIGIPPFVFVCIMKSFCLFTIINLNIKERNYLGFYIVLIFCNFINVFQEPLLRNLISASCFWLSYINYNKNKKILSCSFLVYSIITHNSALLMLAFLILAIIIYNSNSICRYVETILLYFIFSSGFIVSKIIDSMKSIPFILALKQIRAGGMLSETRFFSITSSVQFFMMLLFIYYIQKIKPDKLVKALFVLAIINCLSIRLGVTFLMLNRVSMFFYPFYFIAIIKMINGLIARDSVKRLVFVSYFIITFIFFSISVTSNHKNIPYSNYYINKMIGNDYSFEYRSNYNRNNSPFKQGETK